MRFYRKTKEKSKEKKIDRESEEENRTAGEKERGRSFYRARGLASGWSSEILLQSEWCLLASGEWCLVAKNGLSVIFLHLTPSHSNSGTSPHSTLYNI